MQFDIKISSYSRQLLEVTFRFTASAASTTLVVPYWRPGRYEAGNFPRNYVGFEAFSSGMAIDFEKITAHSWEVETPVNQEITIQYQLYAAELTAGNTYIDEEVLLLNPVNALLYIPGRENEGIELHLELPEDWSTATSLQPEGVNGSLTHHRFSATDMQELMDSPILAALDLQTYSYTSHGINFHVHISAYLLQSSTGVLADFKAFTDSQIAAFGTFPVNGYHFLLLFLPKAARHGVEHEASTVIIMGPSAQMDQKSMYNSLLAISSHELYHTWNVKYLRPEDWTPYDFSGPSFSRLGYIAEGVTTYMGDWMLWQAGVFTDDEFLESLSAQWQRHMDNQGRFNLSLGDASIDTWTDGYGGGAPERRISIYTEGALLALICDAWLVNHSQGQSGLWLVMRKLYQDIDPEVGYDEDDYWAALQAEAPSLAWSQLRAEVIDDRGKLEDYVISALQLIGLKSEAENNNKGTLSWWGAQLHPSGSEMAVGLVHPDSPAMLSGLWTGHVIEQINNTPAKAYLDAATESQLQSQTANLNVRAGYKSKQLVLQPNGNSHATSYHIKKDPNGNTSLFNSWKQALGQVS